MNWQLKRLEIAGRWFEEETMIDSWGLGCECSANLELKPRRAVLLLLWYTSLLV